MADARTRRDVLAICSRFLDVKITFQLSLLAYSFSGLLFSFPDGFKHSARSGPLSSSYLKYVCMPCEIGVCAIPQ